MAALVGDSVNIGCWLGPGVGIGLGKSTYLKRQSKMNMHATNILNLMDNQMSNHLDDLSALLL